MIAGITASGKLESSEPVVPANSFIITAAGPTDPEPSTWYDVVGYVDPTNPTISTGPMGEILEAPISINIAGVTRQVYIYGFYSHRISNGTLQYNGIFMYTPNTVISPLSRKLYSWPANNLLFTFSANAGNMPVELIPGQQYRIEVTPS